MSQSGFSFFRSTGWFDEKKVDLSSKQDVAPSLSILLDKEIYRPGDLVTATVEICSPKVSNGYTDGGNWSNKASSFLLDNFSFEVKGLEKLDSQWFSTQKPLPGLKQRRGSVFLQFHQKHWCSMRCSIFLLGCYHKKGNTSHCHLDR